MITLVEEVPFLKSLTAEAIKINCLFESYKNDSSVMFWSQNNGQAVISMTDGNMIIFNQNAKISELKDFVDFLNPVCVFGNIKTLSALKRFPSENINVMHRKADITGNTPEDTLSSKEIYDLLDVDGLSLPEYPYFAVDYCRRLNKGVAKSFALKKCCAAVSFNCGDYAVMNGIASHINGYGSIALKGILQKNYGKDFLVCCRDSVKPFYEKNGFEKLYNAGYWVKTNERK